MAQRELLHLPSELWSKKKSGSALPSTFITTGTLTPVVMERGRPVLAVTFLGKSVCTTLGAQVIPVGGL